MQSGTKKTSNIGMQYLAVAVGGIIGASLREGIELLLSAGLTDHLPIATMLINWSGSLFLAWFYTKTIWISGFPQWLRAGIGTGVVGAYTTFSTFSVEANTLLTQNIALGIMYVVASVVGGLGFAWIGIRLAGEKAKKPEESVLETSPSKN